MAQHIFSFRFHQFSRLADLGFSRVFSFNLRPFFCGFILKYNLKYFI